MYTYIFFYWFLEIETATWIDSTYIDDICMHRDNKVSLSGKKQEENTNF